MPPGSTNPPPPIPLDQLRRRDRLWIMSFAGMLIVGLGVLIGLSLYRSYETVLREADSTSQALVKSVETYANRTVFAVDAMLLGVGAQIDSAYPNSPPDGPEIKRLLRQLNEQTLQVRDIRILDTNGILLNDATTTRTRRVDLSNAPSIRQFKAGSGLTLALGPPERNPMTRTWSVYMTRPLRLANGFNGLISAEVPTSTFNDFFNSINVSDLTRITLVSEDGSIISTEPPDESAAGRSIADLPIFQNYLVKDRLGTFRAEGIVDPGERVFSFRQVPARPLLAIVSIDIERMVATWSRDAFPVVLIYLAISIVIFGFSWALVRTVTRQRATVEELRVSEAQAAEKSSLLQTTLDNMSEGLSVFSPDLKLVAWNNRFIDMLELPSDYGTYGVPLSQILKFQAERGDFGQVDVDREVEERLHRIPENRFSTVSRTQGQGRILQIRRRPMPDGGSVTVYSDITEDQRRQAELTQARELAERASQAKSEFLSSVSHELRTPLNAILGFAQLLEFNPIEPLSQSQAEAVGMIKNGGNHLLRLINDILDLARIESGGISISVERVDLKALLVEARDQLEPLARKNAVNLVISPLPEGFPDLKVDRTRMLQVLMNLGANAIKYNQPQGKVVMSAELRPDEIVRITVSDTGIGIPEDRQDQLFQPFNRLGAEAGTIEGTGIGLTITRRLVELMSGSIGFSSKSGEGSIFWVELPALTAPEPQLTMPLPITDIRPSAPRENNSIHVLYVEDNPSNMMLMERLLSTVGGTTLLSAPDAERGIGLAISEQPEVIVLDINLPGMSGFDAIKVLKSDPRTSKIPVIALSANAMPRDVSRGLALGFADYLTKPVNVRELLTAIDRAVAAGARRATEQPLAHQNG